jgi:hypothetical protein
MKKWPFPSSDPRVAPEPTPQPEQDEDSPYCECDNELTMQELDTNKCQSCGKVICP